MVTLLARPVEDDTALAQLAARVGERILASLIGPAHAALGALDLLRTAEDRASAGPARELVERATTQLLGRLAFLHAAHGGLDGAVVPLAELRAAAQAFFVDSRLALSWSPEDPPAGPGLALPGVAARGLSSLLLTLAECLAVRGRLAVRVWPAGGPGLLRARLVGHGRLVPAAAAKQRMLAAASVGRLDADLLYPYLAALAARRCGMRLSLALHADRVVASCTLPCGPGDG